VALINTFRSLAEEQETEAALQQIAGVTSVGNIQLIATNAKEVRACSNFRPLFFTGVETEKVGSKQPSLRNQ